MPDLEIKNLHVAAGDKQILKGVDLTVRVGEFHALMGPNGSGKSTLANAVMGHPNLEVTEGSIHFAGQDITEAEPDERDSRVQCSHLEDGEHCATKLLWTRVQMGVIKSLQRTTLAELVEFAAPSEPALEIHG